jgi:hypothetical protein
MGEIAKAIICFFFTTKRPLFVDPTQINTGGEEYLMICAVEGTTLA